MKPFIEEETYTEDDITALMAAEIGPMNVDAWWTQPLARIDGLTPRQHCDADPGNADKYYRVLFNDCNGLNG